VASSHELSCQELVELVTDYLEKTLSPEDRARFERHLSVCPGCVTYLEQIRQTSALAGRISEESIPPEAEENLLRAFRDWKSRPRE